MLPLGAASATVGLVPGITVTRELRGNTVDTSFSPEDLAFRDEVRAFFAQAYDD